MKFETVIWDWNGTLLNDLSVAVTIINQMLIERNLKPITVEHYLEVFTFPVCDYYEQIGFDLEKEPFEIPAFQFISNYNIAVQTCRLHRDVTAILGCLKDQGYRQFILSAMEQQQLEKTVQQSGIPHFFEELVGLDNHFANSKIENGREMFTKRGLTPELTVLIGDTVHDYEVAEAIGCKCILVTHGHQSQRRLMKTGAKVVDSLDEIIRAISEF